VGKRSLATAANPARMEAKKTASLVVNPGLDFIGLFRFGQNIRSADCSE
jgi:hypothetical protein